MSSVVVSQGSRHFATAYATTNQTYSRHGAYGTLVGTVTLPGPGTYRILSGAPPGSSGLAIGVSPFVARARGRDEAWQIATAGPVVGLLLCLVVLGLRRRPVRPATPDRSGIATSWAPNGWAPEGAVQFGESPPSEAPPGYAPPVDARPVDDGLPAAPPACRRASPGVRAVGRIPEVSGSVERAAGGDRPCQVARRAYCGRASSARASVLSKAVPASTATS